MRILIVDDDKDIRKIMKVYLQGEGFEVIEGENGEEALELIQPDIDMVILDIMMPKMDGITACSKIREKYFMPILFLTAKVEDMDKIAGLTVGADDYITKPFNPMEMVARVKSNLRRYITYKSLESDSKKDDATVELLDINIDIRGHRVKKSGVEEHLLKPNLEYWNF